MLLFKHLFVFEGMGQEEVAREKVDTEKIQMSWIFI